MKRIEFMPPKTVAIPEGTNPGETFQALSTYRLKPTGAICLVKIGESELPGYAESKAPDDGSKAMGANAAGRYREKMGGY